MSSGFPESDAQSDFSRARRARLLADIGRRLRREPDDVALMLPFEEVVEALGRTGQRDLGLQVVPLDAIVGTVDRGVDFDRAMRPTSARLRSRWERIASAQRRGEALPPIVSTVCRNAASTEAFTSLTATTAATPSATPTAVSAVRSRCAAQ